MAQGHANYLEYTNGAFNSYTDSPSPAQQQWFQIHFASMVVYSPYFDTRTSWFPKAYFYQNLYAIAAGSWAQNNHPEWILHDQYGNWLYIPYNCGGGTCPRYAGDIANPAFRAWWISQASTAFAGGHYPGMFIDDVNMEFRVSDGWGNQVAPIDSNTGQLMTYDAWRFYVAIFTEQIRAAFPSARIIENSLWFAGPAGVQDADPYVQRQIATASVINIERGVANDGGLTGGTGFWSVYSLFNYIDRLHAAGKSVNFQEYGLDPAGQQYGLASYFLISNGADTLGDNSTTPYYWFNGYDVNLGPALGPRTYNNGVFQRNFAGGIVLMGEPGLATQSIPLPGWLQMLDGTWVNSVSLSAYQGIILRGGPPTVGNTQWTALGGTLTGRAAAGVNADGRLEAFVRAGDNSLWHSWQTSAGGSWSGWSALGGSLASNPVVVANADGRLEVFALGPDNGLWHTWQTTPGGSWSGWGALGGVSRGDPTVIVNADGRLEAFVQGTDGSLWHAWQVSAGGYWSGWASLGGAFTGRPAAIKNADGRLEVFVRGTDNALWHLFQNSPGGAWSGWSWLGSAIAASPAVAINADGRLEAVALGTNGGLWDISQTNAGGNWSGWTYLGGSGSAAPAITANADGRLEIFFCGADNALWHIWQTTAGGAWSAWASLNGGLLDEPTAAKNADGRLDVFVRGTDNSLWHTAQSSAGAWH